MIRRLFLLAVPGVLASLAPGCSTVPETGRSQLNLIPATQEVQLGIASFDKMKKEMKVSQDGGLKALVQKVGRRIAAVAPLENAQWEFVVFDSKEANAFCLPSGKVGVYTGIFQIARDEAGLATVIGHEVAHAVARHGTERLSQALLLEAGGSFLGAAFGDSSPRAQAATATVYGLGTQLGLALPHSRMQESEADELGLIYMARAGYDPEAAVGFWERFAAYNQSMGGQTPWFLRTHPLDAKRIQQLRDWMPRAKQEYRPQP
jgi:predicted Zn-dependent protease